MLGQTNAKVVTGGGVTVEKENYYIAYDSNTAITTAQSLEFIPFNVDSNKCIRASGGYGGGLTIVSLGTSSTTTVASVNGDAPSNFEVAEDDSFFIYWYSGSLKYVPVNSDYTVGTVISVNTTDLGYGTNNRKVFILSSTRFGFYDYTNSKIGIFKLENGALVEDKSIDCSNLSLVGQSASSFEGKIVLLINKTSGSPTETGIRIIDPDTETTLYEDIRSDKTNAPYSCCQKDNYLFVYNMLNAQPYVTIPVFVYEYSNSQFSKKSISAIDYTSKQLSNNIDIRAYKKSEGVYLIMATNYVNLLEYSFFICDITEGTVEGNFFNAGSISVFAKGFGIVTVNNTPTLFVSSYYTQSYYTYYQIFYGYYSTEKTPSELLYGGNTFTLTAIGE